VLILGYVLAGLMGLSLGLLGGGGSILTVPILVYVLGFEPKPAIALSLAIVGVVSLFGAAGHWRAGRVQLRIALLFGITAMAGAFIGARVAASIPGAIQLTLLAVIMVLASVSMFRQGPVELAQPATARSGAALPIGKIMTAALSVGLLTGVIGIGGGFLIVPALLILGRVPLKQSVGTSLVIIAMNSFAGFAGYWGQVIVPWKFLAGFTGFAIVGVLVGTYVVRFVSAHALKRGFALFLLVIGVLVLYQNRSVYTSQEPAAAVTGKE